MRKYDIAEPVPHFVADELKLYPDLIKNLLFHRGITNKEEADIFLNPNYEKHLHDPFLMVDMEKACRRVLEAINKNQKIVVFSDYDADGIPGAVVLDHFFKLIGFKNFEVYIPHRHSEGFGLNKVAVESLAKGGAELIITVDCGITDVESVEKATEQGVDVIITDHHLTNGKLPEAYAILDSKRDDDGYPYKMLCGSGVAFKFMVALAQIGEFNLPKGWEKWLLDMVGLATLADRVPLTGENRVLARYGLLVLRKSRRLGLIKLLSKLKIKQYSISEDDIGFMLAPRINAASRMDVPMDAFKLLSTDDEVEAGALANHLDKINNERKGLVASTVKEIKKKLKSTDDLKEVFVIGNPSWRPGLLGLVAGSIAEEYDRPVFLWGREGGSVIKGSCRSNNKVNLLEMMQSTEKSFLAFGGHAFSGGFSVSSDKIHLLEEKLIKVYKKLKNKKIKNEKLIADWRANISDITWQVYDHLEKISPFGEGNPKPKFLFEDVEIIEVKTFGKTKNHLELILNKGSGNKISAIGFFISQSSFNISLESRQKINLLASVEKSFFGRSPQLRLRIIDIF